MKDYARFIFQSYALDTEAKKISLRYSLDGDVEFEETLLLPIDREIMIDEMDPRLERALFMLHILGGISYYKTCLPKELEIRSGWLSMEQAKFFNEVYEKGLGEFFYHNKIDFRGLIDFIPLASDTDKTAVPASLSPNPNPRVATLVPIGGGKDSLTTMEMLKKTGANITLFRLGSHPIITAQAEVAGLPLLTIERHLSQKLFELNEDGALNGHVPITAYLSAVTIVAALLYDQKAVVFSNERSADYGNTEYLGMTINHQWSKSEDFERMFRERVRQDIDPEINYHSILRNMSELGIASQFAKEPKYFPLATSCNANWRILKERPKETWCGKCPKCAFSFAILSPFLEEETLIGMFGKNLFNEEHLLPTYRELLGLEGIKPFECVGTPEETKAALILDHEKGKYKDSLVMKFFEKEVLKTIKDPKALVASCLS